MFHFREETMNHPEPAPETGVPIGAAAGMICTAILAVTYLCFVLLGAFATGWMAQTVFEGGTVTISLAFGFGIMALGLVLTAIYALLANAADTPATGKSGG